MIDYKNRELFHYSTYTIILSTISIDINIQNYTYHLTIIYSYTHIVFEQFPSLVVHSTSITTLYTYT